jgi:hypothetical protein
MSKKQLHKWTEAEIAYIIENCDKLKDIEIAVELTRITGRIVTRQEIYVRRKKFNIKKSKGKGKCIVINK